jgi:hypothetical protein
MGCGIGFGHFLGVLKRRSHGKRRFFWLADAGTGFTRPLYWCCKTVLYCGRYNAFAATSYLTVPKPVLTLV